SLATPSFTIPQESFLHQAAEMFPSCKEQILEIGAHQSLSFVYMEQPEHTRVRGLFQPQFTRAAINQFRPRLQKIVSEMLDKINPQNQVELRYEFAEPFAIRALREYMWPPKFDGELFFLWVDALLAIRSQSMISDPQGTIEHYLKLNEAVLDYIRSIVIDRRINPSNDLLSHWIKTAFDENDEQPERMLLENLKVIIVAGIVTTPNSIINTIRLLCAHPEQFEEVKANLNLVPQAFKESLRHSATVQMTYRRAAKDFEIHGVEIHANDNIGLCLGAANRDPRIFESPHIFNIHRK
ncbi:cytochrome P450, partial [Zooshikella sp. RANM57]|uniref:cytochrome P450 n=1 Tax=Zooshikella sp. RANM57 TaxID=3425863 RepID=UPI003D6FDAEB